MDKLREEFEAEFKRRNCNVPASRIKTMLELYNYGTEENPDCDYYSLDARHAFEWWQAAHRARLCWNAMLAATPKPEK